MAILFSAVQVKAGEDSVSLLVSGSPKSTEDLSGWKAYEYFLMDIGKEAEVTVDVKSYLYGEGEVFKASLEEVAYMGMRIRMQDNFLEDRCRCVGGSNFSFSWCPEELFGLKETVRMEQHP